MKWSSTIRPCRASNVVSRSQSVIQSKYVNRPALERDRYLLQVDSIRVIFPESTGSTDHPLGSNGGTCYPIQTGELLRSFGELTSELKISRRTLVLIKATPMGKTCQPLAHNGEIPLSSRCPRRFDSSAPPAGGADLGALWSTLVPVNSGRRGARASSHVNQGGHRDRSILQQSTWLAFTGSGTPVDSGK